MDEKQLETCGAATRLIHVGRGSDAQGSPQLPLYDTTTFRFESTSALLDVVEGRRSGCLYTRYGSNPTIRAAEEKLADLDGAEAALLFASGMAALSALFLAHGRRGILCIGETYGGTQEFLSRQLPALGIETRFVPASGVAQLEAHLAWQPGLVFFETPANPTLEIIDIARVAAAAHRHGALVALDNTFATPINQQPLALGVDLAMQSATKYLGGHSDLTAGVVTGAAPVLAPLLPWRKNLGQICSPETAHLLARSLATLSLRVAQHNANAQYVAERLAAHPRVKKVYYPGLKDFAGHAIARQQMTGFGGMLTIDIEGTFVQAVRVIDGLRLIALAPSLGGVESLATQPATTSHHDLTAAERAARGITDTMIRLSVGIEDGEDLAADLEQALAAASGTP